MPRSSRHVKSKTNIFRKEYIKLIRLAKRHKGVIDLHFHGAYGIDLMKCGADEFKVLCKRLFRDRVIGFYPTTLTSPWPVLLDRLALLGQSIRAVQDHWTTEPKFAFPIGIHLEGPFLNPKASGAHRPEWCLVPTVSLLEEAWKRSGGTLKIVTLAPEQIALGELKPITGWAHKRKVLLSIGHTRASYSEASSAFQAGFQGVTHAFNAMNFHHRDPGVLGAALDHGPLWVEAIGDAVHLHPSTLAGLKRWFPDSLCLVSDCAPCAALAEGATSTFSDLTVSNRSGAAYTPEGRLAGGAKLLSQQKDSVKQAQFNLLNPSQLIDF